MKDILEHLAGAGFAQVDSPIEGVSILVGTKEPTVRFTITFKLGPKVISKIESVHTDQSLTMADLTWVIPTEQFLERLTGLRVHIQQVFLKNDREEPK